MSEARVHATAEVIPFPDTASRGSRRLASRGGPLGEILLFTGVRYDWQPEPTPAPPTPVAPGGQRRTSRRRRS